MRDFRVGDSVQVVGKLPWTGRRGTVAVIDVRQFMGTTPVGVAMDGAGVVYFGSADLVAIR